MLNHQLGIQLVGRGADKLSPFEIVVQSAPVNFPVGNAGIFAPQNALNPIVLVITGGRTAGGVLLRTDPQARALPACSLHVVCIGFQAFLRRISVARKLFCVKNLRAEVRITADGVPLRIGQLPTVAHDEDHILFDGRILRVAPAGLGIEHKIMCNDITNGKRFSGLGHLRILLGALNPPGAEGVRRIGVRFRNEADRSLLCQCGAGKQRGQAERNCQR